MFARALRQTQQQAAEAERSRVRIAAVVRDALAYSGTREGFTLFEPYQFHDHVDDIDRPGVRIGMDGTWYRRWLGRSDRAAFEEVIPEPERYFTGLNRPERPELQALQAAPPGSRTRLFFSIESNTAVIEDVDLEALSSPEGLAALYFVRVAQDVRDRES